MFGCYPYCLSIQYTECICQGEMRRPTFLVWVFAYAINDNGNGKILFMVSQVFNVVLVKFTNFGTYIAELRFYFG